MRLFYVLFSVALTATAWLNAQTAPNFWRDVRKEQMVLPRNAEVDMRVTDYRTLMLDASGLEAWLRRAPQEDRRGAKPLSLELPLPDGTTQRFGVVASSNFMPELAARYPEIQSYSAVGLDDSRYTARFDYSPRGFYGSIFTPQGTVYIDPYASVRTDYYLAYFIKDWQLREEDLPQLVCGVEHDPLPEEIEKRERRLTAQTRAAAPQDLLTYRLALACTGEFAQRNGGTRASVLAAMNTVLNRVNQVFAKETAVKLLLISNNDSLIYLDPATDPYTNPTLGSAVLDQNPGVLNQKIGAAAYDVGHCFTGGCTDVGGVASGSSVCGVNKARGVTCFGSNDLNRIAVEILAHELGHQFSCGHSWNNCPSSIDQLSPANAFEPGSGSTIMSYSGSCGINNIQNTSDDYYNIGSLEDFIFFSRQGGGRGCATVVPTTNEAPAAAINRPTASLTLPISTPFQLTAAATDANNDNLTYCWEQYDTGESVTLGMPEGNAPIFRSLPPTSSPTRFFPRLSTVLRNTVDRTEVLPAYARDLTFRVTVRDNHPTAAGVDWEEIKFKVTDQAGPFVVTYPNEGGLSFAGASDFTVRWDVAKTNQLPVNARFVNIRLSVDGGNTYPYLLAERALNNGEAQVTLPNVTSPSARIRVEASDHVFYDLSNNDFRINATTVPAFQVNVAPYSVALLCQPNQPEFKINTTAIGGFDRPIKLELLGDVPVDVPFAFTNASVRPGDSSFLRFDARKLSRDTVVATIRASVAGVDTILRPVYFVAIGAHLQTVQATAPADGAGGIQLSTAFTWSALPNIGTYEFELDTTPILGAGSFIRTTTNGLSFTPTTKLLPDNKLFFWRVRSVTNECGVGPWSPVRTLQTVSSSCKKSESTNVPVAIPARNAPTIESRIVVTESGIINDVNVPLIRIRHEYVRNLRITLISPKGTQVVLYNEGCRGLTDRFLVGYDDIAPRTVDQACPPDDGIVFRPVGQLSAFNGEEQQGTWTLRVQVTRSEGTSPGTLESWQLEFCSLSQGVAPTLALTDTLRVPNGRSTLLTTQLLQAQSPGVAAEQLQFILVNAPLHGQLQLQGRSLTVGETFTQADVNAGRVGYLHDGKAGAVDACGLVVRNLSGGGFLPLRQLPVKILGGTVGLNEPQLSLGVVLYPNPAQDELQLELDRPLDQAGQIRVFNLSGQQVQWQSVAAGVKKVGIATGALPAGAYWLQLRTAAGVLSRPFVIQRQ